MSARFAFLILFWIGLGSLSARASVDLHAHLFFYDGTGLPLIEKFSGSLAVKSWNKRIGSKVNLASLNASGASIVVAALYAHPLFLVSERESIRRQLVAADNLLRADPTWGLAKNAREARVLLGKGRKVLVLALEGASGILESEEDLKEFLDLRGISIVTPLHFMDDDWGGAAFLPGAAVLASPFAWLRSLLSPTRDAEGVRLNPQGLTVRGRWLTQALLKRQVWVDLAHSSDATQKDILALSGQPILYTHTMLRRYYRAERGISLTQLAQVQRHGGFVGLLPSEDMLAGTEVTPAFCQKACPSCEGGVPALLQQYSEIASQVGASSVSLGSDINAPLQLLKPECGQALGFNEYGDLARLFAILETRGGYSAQTAQERFLTLWSKVRP